MSAYSENRYTVYRPVVLKKFKVNNKKIVMVPFTSYVVDSFVAYFAHYLLGPKCKIAYDRKQPLTCVTKMSCYYILIIFSYWQDYNLIFVMLLKQEQDSKLRKFQGFWTILAAIHLLFKMVVNLKIKEL